MLSNLLKKALILLARPKRFELLTPRFVSELTDNAPVTVGELFRRPGSARGTVRDRYVKLFAILWKTTWRQMSSLRRYYETESVQPDLKWTNGMPLVSRHFDLGHGPNISAARSAATRTAERAKRPIRLTQAHPHTY
jgi:hypothetical protein